MKMIKTYIFRILPIILFSIISCNEVDSKINISISHNILNGKIKLNDTLKIRVDFLTTKNFKDSDLNNLLFDLKSNNNKYELKPFDYDKTTKEYHFLLDKISLGKKELIIKLNNTNKRVNFTLLNDKAPKIYNYEIINEFSRGLDSYTQGFEFYNDTLYESLGQYGKSKLVKVDYRNGNILKEYKLESNFFAEGITVLNTFNQINSFEYNKSLEGWGICNDGDKLYKSDGTEKIWLLNPDNQQEEGYIEIYTNKNKVVGLNELEWVDGKIFANRYLFDGIAIINPSNGAIDGVINLSSLKGKVTQHENLDVINGIAYNKKRNSIFVTGKMWDKIFEIRIKK